MPFPAPYRAPSWLPGGHAQTIYASLIARPEASFRRERIETPDGDFWDLDWIEPPQSASATAECPRTAPLVVLFHGLEGSSGSHYARALMRLLVDIGWHGVVPHFRGCSGEPNRVPRAYHSGDHEEIGAMLGAIGARSPTGTPAAPTYVVGVSLGGSALLNWLGRTGPQAAFMVAAAAAVSTPLDLTAAGLSIDRGFNRIYAYYFLRTLRPKSMAIAERFPGLLDPAPLPRIRTMYEFDDAVTAPMHGFAGTDDYWLRASSKPWLRDVAIPTLVLNARNDPFVPGDSLPGPAEVSSSVTLEQPEDGGHVGFVTSPFPGNLGWLPRRLVQFFASASSLSSIPPPATR